MSLLGYDSAQPKSDVQNKSDEQHLKRIYFSSLIIKEANMITSADDALN